jgi:hypothetical protein
MAAERIADRDADRIWREVMETTIEISPVSEARLKKRGRQLRKQKLPREIAELTRKRTPARMRTILDSLAEFPVEILAARRAGVHRNTPLNWRNSSAAGRAGYDLEWCGVTAKFHEHHESAMKEGDEKLLEVIYERALGYDEVRTYRGEVIYKVDEFMWELGFRGPEAYLKDEDGNPVPETVRRQDPKMIRWLAERRFPHEFGPPHNRDFCK